MAEEVGHPLDAGRIDVFHRYRHWLVTEAVSAGGIGAAEVERVDQRHLADSLLFAHFFESPRELWDLGSGVGLPGVPLAILHPETRCVLVDRSGRRVDLLRRAVRVLGLENVDVLAGDITRLQGESDVVVSRASMRPQTLAGPMSRLLTSGGTGVVGGSWLRRPEAPGWEISQIASGSLDRTVWFLIMRR